MTVGASGFAVRILSCETFGAGGTMAALKVGEVRVAVRETSGAGGMMLVVRMLGVRLADEFNSGEGGTTLMAGRVGAVREERRPSAGRSGIRFEREQIGDRGIGVRQIHLGG